MPRTGGIFSLPPGYFAVSGQVIQPSNHNPPLEDIAQALTDSLPRSGAASMTGNLQMGGNKITGIGAATQPGHVPRWDQVLPASGGTVSGDFIVGPFDPTNANGRGARIGLGSSAGVVQSQSRASNAPSTPIIQGFYGSEQTFRVEAAGNVTISGTFSGSGAQLTNVPSGSLTGTIPNARLPSDIVRESRTINTGTGISGGGNLSANRTFALDVSSVSIMSGTMNDGRLLAWSSDTGQGMINQVTLRNQFNLADSRNNLTAGAGLTGGGDWTSSRTVAMGTPSSITRTSTNNASGNTHTHNLPQADFRDMMANYLAAGQEGELCFAKNKSGGTTNFGTTVAGSNLEPSSAAGTDITVSLTGTWRCLGYAPNTGVTLYRRIS